MSTPNDSETTNSAQPEEAKKEAKETKATEETKEAPKEAKETKATEETKETPKETPKETKAEKEKKVEPAADQAAPPASGEDTAFKAEIPKAETSNAEMLKTDGQKIEAGKSEGFVDLNKLDILNDLTISLTIEVGRAQIKIRDLLNLAKGSIIELDKAAGDPVDIYANGKLISIGSIITANGKYCVRLMSIPENHKGES